MIRTPADNDGRPVVVGTAVARHPAAAEALSLWCATSALPFCRDVGTLSFELLDYVGGVWGACDQRFADLPAVDPVSWGTPADDGTMWVAYSGGRDSTAAALRCRAAGWDVVLYHVAGINRSYPDERAWAERGAAALGMPLVVDTVRITGKGNGVVEAPTKNQVIAALMAARMATGAGAHYTLGVHGADAAARQTPLRNWSDGIETVEAYAAYLAARLPGLQFHPVLRDGTQALVEVASAGMLDHVHSCMAAHRFRKSIRAANEKRFGPLPPGRCGGCYKCAAETLALHEMGVQHAPHAHREHAEAVLAKFAAKYPGERAGDFFDRSGALANRRPQTDWPSGPAPVTKIPAYGSFGGPIGKLYATTQLARDRI